jgi:hypothetical protein
MSTTQTANANQDSQTRHVLRTTPETVVWGFSGPEVAPVLKMASGDGPEIRVLEFPIVPQAGWGPVWPQGGAA